MRSAKIYSFPRAGVHLGALGDDGAGTSAAARGSQEREAEQRIQDDPYMAIARAARGIPGNIGIMDDPATVAVHGPENGINPWMVFNPDSPDLDPRIRGALRQAATGQWYLPSNLLSAVVPEAGRVSGWVNMPLVFAAALAAAAASGAFLAAEAGFELAAAAALDATATVAPLAQGAGEAVLIEIPASYGVELGAAYGDLSVAELAHATGAVNISAPAAGLTLPNFPSWPSVPPGLIKSATDLGIRVIGGAATTAATRALLPGSTPSNRAVALPLAPQEYYGPEYPGLEPLPSIGLTPGRGSDMIFLLGAGVLALVAVASVPTSKTRRLRRSRT